MAAMRIKSNILKKPGLPGPNPAIPVKRYVMYLYQVNRYDWIRFPGRRKRYQVLSHNQQKYIPRSGHSFSYTDGRNYDIVSGTRLRDTSGRTYVVDSSRYVELA